MGSTDEYRVPKNATAMEALDAALAANKMTSEKKYGDTLTLHRFTRKEQTG